MPIMLDVAKIVRFGKRGFMDYEDCEFTTGCQQARKLRIFVAPAIG